MESSDEEDTEEKNLVDLEDLGSAVKKAKEERKKKELDGEASPRDMVTSVIRQSLTKQGARN